MTVKEETVIIERRGMDPMASVSTAIRKGSNEFFRRDKLLVRSEERITQFKSEKARTFQAIAHSCYYYAFKEPRINAPVWIEAPKEHQEQLERAAQGLEQAARDIEAVENPFWRIKRFLKWLSFWERRPT